MQNEQAKKINLQILCIVEIITLAIHRICIIHPKKSIIV